VRLSPRVGPRPGAVVEVVASWGGVQTRRSAPAARGARS
jgi:hypothetical protein